MWCLKAIQNQYRPERMLPAIYHNVGPAEPNTDYPFYIKDQYRAWLNGFKKQAVEDDGGNAVGTVFNPDDYMNVADEMTAIKAEMGGSPYRFITAYDPNTDLDVAQAALDELSDEVDVEPSVDVGDAVLESIMLVNQHMFPDSELDAVVDSYENQQMPSFQREVSRVAAGYFDIQATMSSQYVMALANMENSRRADLSDFASKLRLQYQQSRMTNAIALTSEMLRIKGGRAAGKQAVAGMQTELSKMKIIAKQDQVNIDLGYVERDTLWNLDLLQHGSAMLGSIYGATTLPRALTPMERLLGGLATGASAGIQAGVATGSPELGVIYGLFTAFAGMAQGGNFGFR